METLDSTLLFFECGYYHPKQGYCGAFSPSQDGRCIVHKNSTDVNFDYSVNGAREFIVEEVKEYLRKVEQTSRATSKLAQVEGLYLFLIKHRFFLCHHRNFEKVALDKLKEFERGDGIPFIEKKKVREMCQNFRALLWRSPQEQFRLELAPHKKEEKGAYEVHLSKASKSLAL